MIHERQTLKKINALIDTYEKVLKTWYISEMPNDKWDIGYNAATENLINELQYILRDEPQ